MRRYGILYKKIEGTFEKQLRSFGASVDWSRFTFTLDDKVVKTAYQTFQKNVG